MFTLIAQNKYGEQLELTHNNAYVITNIDGLDPPDSVINTTRNASADGSVFNSSYVDNRTIAITLSINGPAEANRINLYKYFKAKYDVRIYYQNATRNVYIDGYVQNFSIELFEKKQIAQIVIFCPNPFFNGNIDNVINFESIIDMFEFPFSIPEAGIEFSVLETENETDVINSGDVETGVLITLRANGTVVNPVIYNSDTGEYFKLNIIMSDGDIITINTKKKEKSVTLTSGGTDSNIIGNMIFGSTWFQLLPGDNMFIVSADTMPENLYCTFIIVNQFEGV